VDVDKMRLQLLAALLTVASLVDPGLCTGLKGVQCTYNVAQIEEMTEELSWPILSELGSIGTYRSALKYFYGDHVDWDGLLAYKISDARWKKSLVKEADEAHQKFLEFIEEHSKPPVEEYQHFQLFRPPNNVNDLWTTEVSIASDMILHYFDKINMIINGGIISKEMNTHFLYKSKKDQLKLLKYLSSIVNYVLDLDIDGYVELLRNKETQEMVFGYLDQNLEHHVACLYDVLASRNLTFYNTFTESITQDRLIKFVNKFTVEAVDLVNADATRVNVETIYSALKKAFKKTDFDTLTAKLLLTFLKSRSLVLGVDISKIFYDLDKVHQAIGEGWYAVREGQWPEMVEFISTFLKNTLKSQKFWLRIDDVYHEQVEAARQQYLDRENSLNNWINNKLTIFLSSILDYLALFRTIDSTLIGDIMQQIKATDLRGFLEPRLDKLTSILTKHYLSCYTALYGKPDFNQVQDMVKKNSWVSFITDIVLVDWPEKKEVPAKFPEFVEKLQAGVLLIFTSSWGSCSDPILTK